MASFFFNITLVKIAVNGFMTCFFSQFYFIMIPEDELREGKARGNSKEPERKKYVVSDDVI